MNFRRSKKRKYPDDGWGGGGGFGAYMKKKAAKLAQQFENGASETSGDSNGKFSKIFKGISIYVNGFTDPPASKLKKLMMMHGGRYIYYPNKSNTTHIVANNLAYTKIKELKNEKVVTPKWIIDSVEAGKLLPHAPYLIYRPKASNQSLHRFAYKKRSEREKEKEAAEGIVSPEPVTDKSCSIKPKSSGVDKSDHTMDASNCAISDSHKKKVCRNEMEKSGERSTVINSGVKKEKHTGEGPSKKNEILVNTQKSKPEQRTALNGHNKHLIQKEARQNSQVKQSKLASVNGTRVGKNSSEKLCGEKCKNDSSTKFANRSLQGGSSVILTGSAGSSAQIEKSSKEENIEKHRRKEESDAVNKQKRKTDGCQQSQKDITAQNKSSTGKFSVPKLKNEANTKFENKSELVSSSHKQLTKNDAVNKPKRSDDGQQSQKDITAQNKSSAGKTSVTKLKTEESTKFEGKSEQVSSSHKQLTKNDAVNKPKRRSDDGQQSQKEITAQNKSSAGKISVTKLKTEESTKFLNKREQGSSSHVQLAKKSAVHKQKSKSDDWKQSQKDITAQNKSCGGQNIAPKLQNELYNKFRNKNEKESTSHVQLIKENRHGDEVKNLSAGKSDVLEPVKEFYSDSANVDKRIDKADDLQQSKKGVSAKHENSSRKNFHSVPKSKDHSKNDFDSVSGRERKAKGPPLQDKTTSSIETKSLKEKGESTKPTQPFVKGVPEHSSLGDDDNLPKSKDYDPKKFSDSLEIEDVPPIQLNNCYFPKSNDPAFLPMFYRHSSFYHLTTWRAEHKIFVKKLHEKGDRSFPGKKKLMALFQKNCSSDQNKCDNSDSAKVENLCENDKEIDKPISVLQNETENEKPRTIMHIDMDAFFVSVSLLNYPELLGMPVAVAHYAAKPKRTEHVVPEKVGQYESKLSPGKGTPPRTDGFKKNVKGELSKEGQNGQQITQLSQGHSNGAPVHPGLGNVASESDNFTSLAAIASCSYEARQSGVRNGMLMKDAKELCPKLQTIPYDFAGYHRISRLLYETVASYTHDITAASCDEVVLDITNLMKETGATAIQIADVIRKEVFEKTKCTASAGLASNVILAKLCTKAAKPNGTFLLEDKDVEGFLKKAPVGDLPGIGRAFSKKMNSLGIFTCEDLQNVSLKVLQKEFGPRTGEILHQNCRGYDTQHLTADRQRKYVSVEVNYGIRFDGDDDAYNFINLLCQKIEQKMKKLGMVGRRISLKLKVRRPGTPVEDPKYMGYGVSDDKIRSVSLSQETNDAGTIERTCKSLFLHMGADAKDLRGVGIQLSLLKKLKKGQAVSKPLTEMLPKKEDLPKSTKQLAPIDDKPKPKTYSMLNFMETKREGSPSPPIQPEYRPIRKWSGVPPLPFSMSPSQCLFPFSKVDPNSLKIDKEDCLLSGKRETAMDLWSKSGSPSSPSSVRKLSLGGNPSEEKEKDTKVESPKLSLGAFKSQEPSPDKPSKLGKSSPFLGCTPTPSKTKKIGTKSEKSDSDQPSVQTEEHSDTVLENPRTDINLEKRSTPEQSSTPTTTASLSGFTANTELKTAVKKVIKPCSDQSFTQTTVSSFIKGTSAEAKTEQSQIKPEKSDPKHSSTKKLSPSEMGCTPAVIKKSTSASKPEKSESYGLDVPLTGGLSSECTPPPSASQKSDSKFQLPPPTELDLSVLRSLPSEICNQIIQEYSSNETKDTVAIQRIKSLSPNKASTSTGITSELDQDVLQSLPPEILQEVLAEERRKVTRRMSEETSDLANEPSSYSEIDKSCLEALPKDLQNEIFEKFKPRQLSQVSSSDLKSKLLAKGELSPLLPDGKGTYSQSQGHGSKRTMERLPLKRDREEPSMQALSLKKGDMDSGSHEMGIEGENERRNSDEDDDQEENSERSKVPNGLHKEEVTNLDGAVELWDVKLKLMQWVDTFEDPVEEDISHVVHYLRTLILEQNLAMVYQVLRALKRIVSKNGKDCWKKACSTIMKRIQSTVHQMYGSTLKLD